MSRRAEVILASAGSGKTWQLTTHFLALLADGVPPERVLASTFTRKAASEILGRIFARLAKAVESDDGRAELDGALGRSRSAAEYLQLLADAARRVQRFRVVTLDAFFVELARAFTSELALPPEWTIADDIATRRARSDAISRALALGEPREWVVLLRELERETSGRRVHETMMDTVAKAHVLALESEPGAWECIRPSERPSADELEDLVARLGRLQPMANKNGQPNSNWVKSLERARRCAAAEAWLAIFENGVGQAVIGSATAFASREIPDEVRAVFLALARVAAADVTREIAAQNRATRDLLVAFDGEYRRAQRERGALRFEDLPHALAGGSGPAATAQLAEVSLRLDTTLDHLLLDEFQDTSPPQWRVLAPIAEELAFDASGTRSFFCVGDVKQSIYGWRAAEPRLFEDLPRQLVIEPTHLDVSRRSAQVVLDAVNRVFERVSEGESFESHEADKAAAVAMQTAYRPHSAHDAGAKGCARVHAAAAGEDARDRQRRCIERAVELVVSIRADAPRASIAILLRRKALASHAVRLLLERGIVASDEGGSPLVDAASVQALCSFLHWLDHPGDSLALFHVSSTPLGAACGLAHTTAAEEAARIWRAARVRLLDRGLSDWLAALLPAVERDYGAWEARRFAGAMEIALAWSEETRLRPGEFVERVREQRVDDSGAAQVKVMTIHASKGLEFDAVILPELDALFFQRSATFAWRRRDEDPTRAIEALSRKGSATERALLAALGQPLLEELDRSTRARALRDELSALYVAMTRARSRLDLVIQPQGSSQPKFSLAGLVRDAWRLGHGDLPPGSIVATVDGSDDGWSVQEAPAPPEPEEAERSPGALRFAPSRRARELERTSPSRPAARAATATGELFVATSDDARLRGRRFHALIERVEWIEDFRASDAELGAHVAAQGLGGPRLEADLNGFRAALERPGLRALLARPSCATEVWRERRFTCVLDGVLVSGAFDRVVLVLDGARVVRADIVDFKTDLLGSRAVALAQHAEHYRPQLAAYRAALAHVLDLGPDAISARLYFVDGDRTLEL